MLTKGQWNCRQKKNKNHQGDILSFSPGGGEVFLPASANVGISLSRPLQLTG